MQKNKVVAKKCECCGKHTDELKPFGGPGDPVFGDFKGALRVKTWRPMHVPDKEERKLVEKFDEYCSEFGNEGDAVKMLKEKYGEKKGESIWIMISASGSVKSSRECRDCIVLNREDYYKKICSTYC